MSNGAYKCPGCGMYILSKYCYKCKIDVTEIKPMDDQDINDFFGEIFKNEKTN